MGDADSSQLSSSNNDGSWMETWNSCSSQLQPEYSHSTDMVLIDYKISQYTIHRIIL